MKLGFFMGWDREVISGHGTALEATDMGRAEEAAEAGEAWGSGPGLSRSGLMITGPVGWAAAGIRTSGMRSAADAAAWARVPLGSGGGGVRFNCSRKILSLYSFIFFEL